METLTGNDEDNGLEEIEEYLQICMPFSSPGVTTFAYQQALQNRIPDGKLRANGEYDARWYKPTFIHDCLMLPGSSANLLGKIDSVELTHRMTPALLPGFRAHVHADTLQPCLLQSTNARDYVQGMVVFGLGAQSRKLIYNHYQANGRRVKVEVEIDVSVAIPPTDRNFERERWRLRRRKVWAHAWLWSNAGSGDAMSRTQAPRWSIDDYLGRNLEPRQAPLVVENWSDVDLDVSEGQNAESRLAEREVLYCGAGNIDYISAAGFTGW
ncbi:hypothetical protein B0A55_12440 [Friedmanniomyces simplex]|uniref:Uncharacterized protein n=1 Tax=Friedmanniomyces simplex TaxID=329884 RepID=A0A4U0VVQ7_9PEZI|nr:hypothetical protein B0A55_12440 [Friedmanniomyces simplex]